MKLVFTIHNIEYQGKYDLAILGDIFALDNDYRSIVEYDGCINLMKGAIITSDYVSTVSPNYANELKYDYFAFGLADIIRSAEHKLTGIINGIDYSYFSPECGGDIDYSYKKSTIQSGKAKNKSLIQKDLSLTVDEKIPLFVMITRLTAGKGIDLLLHIIQEFLTEKVQLVVLGTGDKEYENALLSLSSEYKNFKALIKFDRSLSKKLYAAADVFIMPSKSEPCGLAQMIACAYGTIPVVRSVGGLYDSIIPYDLENSNGFRFDNFNAHELLQTLKDAKDLYNNKQKWNALRLRAINTDFSWSKSAAKYIALYNNILNW